MTTGIDFSKLAGARKALEDRRSSNSDFQTVMFWKPKLGQNKVRILPPWTSEGPHAGAFWREVAQHWNVSEDMKGPVLCPNKTPDIKDACPICEFITELKSDKKNVAAQELAKEIRAKTSWFLNLVDLSDSIYTAADVAEAKQARPDEEVGFAAGDLKVQVYAAGPTVFNNIVTIISENNLDITLPEKGHNLTITKSGKGLNTEYNVTIMITPTALEGWTPATKVNDLSQVGYVQEYSKILELLSEGKARDFMKGLPSGKAGKALAPAAVLEDDDLPESWSGPSDEGAEEDMASALEAEMLAEARKAG